MAARLFVALKLRGVDVELQEEHARRAILQDQMSALLCQPYLFGQQLFELQRRAAQTDVVLMDSPLLLNPVYDRNRSPALEALVLESVAEFRELNLVLERPTHTYHSLSGRIHTRAESIELDGRIQQVLDRHAVAYERVAFDSPDAVESLVERIQSAAIASRIG